LSWREIINFLSTAKILKEIKDILGKAEKGDFDRGRVRNLINDFANDKELKPKENYGIYCILVHSIRFI